MKTHYYSNNWVSIVDVEELYDNISVSSIHTSVSLKKKAGEDVSMWYKTNGVSGRKSDTMVNIGYLQYVYERRRKIQFYCQEKYYTLVDEIGQAELCKRFAKYLGRKPNGLYKFFTEILFANTYNLNLSYTHINKTLIKFHNFCNEYFCDVYFDSVEEECDYNEANRILNKG